MFYKKLTELCRRRGISVTKFCQEIGMSNATASKWKNGAKPFYSTLFKIAQYFDVDAEYLVDDEYMDYDEWLAEVKHMSRAVVAAGIEWIKEVPHESEPQPYEALLPLIKQLTPAQVQRVKDFISGILS